MFGPDFDRLADKAYPNPYEADGGPYKDRWSCGKCLIYIEIMRDPNSDKPLDEYQDLIDEHSFHMRTACGWCKKAMGYKPCAEARDGQISHGMCDECRKDWLSKVE